MAKSWIWITGADGHVGSALKLLLSGKGYHLLCTNQEDVDVTDAEAVRLYADMNRPAIIINCAGLTNVATCEANPEEAYKVNTIGARNIAAAAQRINARMVQLSTDDVFDGRTEAPINEFDPAPRPRSVYGKSKLAGEEMVNHLCDRHFIIRSSWVYGTGADFVDDFTKASGSMEVPNNEFAVPTSAKELAKVILALIKTSNYGVYHVVCTGGPVSRYEYARTLKELTGKDIELIPVLGSSDRPVYSVLDDMMLRINGIDEPANWLDALKEFLGK